MFSPDVTLQAISTGLLCVSNLQPQQGNTSLPYQSTSCDAIQAAGNIEYRPLTADWQPEIFSLYHEDHMPHGSRVTQLVLYAV